MFLGMDVETLNQFELFGMAGGVSYTLSKVNVKDISVKDADIEEIIRRLYKKEVEVDA